MAWVEVKLIRDSFEDGAEGASGERVYSCRADQPIGLEEALTASHGGRSVPPIGASWSAARPFCAVRTRRVRRVAPHHAEVTVSYSDPSFGGAEDEEDLLALPARITRTGEVWMEPYEVDATTPTPLVVRNSAGDRFDQMPERQVGVGVFQIRKFVDATGRAAIDAVWNTVNNGTKMIDGVSCAAGTLWMGDPPTFSPVEGASGVYEAQYAVKYKRDGWKDRVLNYGFRELLAGKPKRITEQMIDDSGNPIGQPRPCTLPWPLKSDGTRKANQTDAPDVLEFQPYALADWSALPVT